MSRLACIALLTILATALVGLLSACGAGAESGDDSSAWARQGGSISESQGWTGPSGKLQLLLLRLHNHPLRGQRPLFPRP